MKTLKILVLALIANFSITTVIAQDNCDLCKELLKEGLYKKTQIDKKYNMTTFLKTYLMSETFRKDFQNSKWGGALGVIADGVPININANSDDTQINEFQAKVKTATTLDVTQSFQEFYYIVEPDNELAKTYRECLESCSSFGFKVTPNIGDKTAFFIISYYNKVSTDPMPKITNINIIGGINVNTMLSIGSEMKNQNTITCDRDPDKDLILIIETTRGVVSYKVPAEPSGFNKDFPVGTIITSYLTWNEFQKVTKNNLKNPDGDLFNSQYSKWAPADGRLVSDKSGFYKATLQTNLPDMRGLFIRGLNSFDPEQEPYTVNQDKKDPDDRRRGSFQNHDTYLNEIYNNPYDVFCGGQLYRNSIQYSKRGITSNPDKIGGTETRPKNIALYYYIRIN